MYTVRWTIWVISSRYYVGMVLCLRLAQFKRWRRLLNVRYV